MTTFKGSPVLLATIQDGLYKGWPLGAAHLIATGAVTPSQMKAALIADQREKIASIEATIAAIQALPDEIVLGGNSTVRAE